MMREEQKRKKETEKEEKKKKAEEKVRLYFCETLLQKKKEATMQKNGADNWVMCDNGKKWFQLPATYPAETLPSSWDCTLITWRTRSKKCCESNSD